MKVDIKVPPMGESISEVTIGTFFRKSGSRVDIDEELLELETDKANQVLCAPQRGIVSWAVLQDDVVAIGQVIGSIETDVSDAKVNTPQQVLSSPVPPKQEKIAPVPTPTPPPKEPSAEKVPSPAKEEPPVKIDENRSEIRKKMSKIRKLIGKRLVDVMQQTAMLTTFNEVDMTEIMLLRELYKDSFMQQHHVKLGFMSFFVKAVVSALEAFPEVNAYIEGDELVYRQYYDIGIAVGTDRGLVVPVVRGCNHLSFAGIEQSIETFAKKAREGGLNADSLMGGGFTITNGGVYGSLLSTPILNPPQSAILGMHKIMKRPVVVNDEIVIRQMMYLALSYDHRVIDGKEAVSFLVHVKNCLEDPSRIFLEV